MPRRPRRARADLIAAAAHERLVDRRGRIIGMQTCGASTARKALRQPLCFEPLHVVAVAKDVLSRSRPGASKARPAPPRPGPI